MSEEILDGNKPWSEVLVAAQTGSEVAISTIYDRHRAPVLRYLRVCDSMLADDIASDVWMDAARNLSTFKGDEGQFTRWLFTIVRRRLIDSQRRRARAPKLSEQTHEEPADSRILKAAEARRAAELIRGTLGGAQAEVVLLRCVAELTVSEVAEVIGKTETAVRVLQHRGLRRLSEVFTAETFFEEVKQLDKR